MAGEAADLVFIDPLPTRELLKATLRSGLRFKATGCQTPSSSSSWKPHSSSDRRPKPGGSLYLCHSSSWQREFQNALEATGFEVRCQIIWAKNTFAWGFRPLQIPARADLLLSRRRPERPSWYGDKSQSTLWEEKKPAANRLHPTMKPVELIERALLNSSKAGDVVADFFGGSGSTLIACERRSRKARLMELDLENIA